MEERLKLFLAMEGLSPSQFADKLGVQRSGVSHLLSGRNKPSFEFISKMLAAYPKPNPDWLIMGTGKAYRGMDGAEIATQAGNDVFPAGNDGFTPAGNDEYTHTQRDLVSKAPLQENPATDDMPDLFSAPSQPEPQPAPEPKTPSASRLPSENRIKQPIVVPTSGKRIAQITILYSDGTYEIR